MSEKSNDTEQRGYQPKPDTTFGYQPSVSNKNVTPKPPKTGSDVKPAKND